MGLEHSPARTVRTQQPCVNCVSSFSGNSSFFFDHRMRISEYFTESCHKLNAITNPDVIRKCQCTVPTVFSVALLTVTEDV